jgi:type I restriction enzyme S subunit
MAGEWPTLSLREAHVKLIDCDHRTPPASDANYPYVAIPQLRNGHIDLSEARRISREHFVDWTRKAMPVANDVVLSRRCNPGETAFVPPGLEFALGQNLVLLRADGVKVYPPFLRWLVQGPEWWEQIGKFLNVGAVFDSLRCADVPNFRLRIPPMPEQRAIAHILGTLDDKIELNGRMNETLEAMALAIFKSWFVDFDPVRAKVAGRDPGLPKPLADLFPDSFDDSELGEIPKGWRISSVGDHMVNFDSKRVPVSGGERAKRQGQYPYHGAAGVMDHVDDYLFDGVYLLVGEDGSVVQSNGMAVTQYVWGKLWVNNHAHVLQGKSAVSTEHLYLYFHFESVVPYVTGAVQPKLSQGRMNTMPFVFAGTGVCLAFAKMVQPLFAKLRANANMNRTLAALRDTLLPKLILGELRVAGLEQTTPGDGHCEADFVSRR